MKTERPDFEKGSPSIRVGELTGVIEHVGESFVSEDIQVSEDKLNAFLEATGDTNSIHFNEQEVKKSVFAEATSGEVIVPGFLTLSLCANEKTLYEALKISELHEVVSLGMSDVKFIAPVPLNSNLSYEYKLKSAELRMIKSRPSVKVNWEITASIISGNDKKPCMQLTWTLGYISLEADK